MEYVNYLVKNKLNAKYYDVDECVSICLMELLYHKKVDFKPYMETNTIPKGNDLKMLKSTVYYAKLNFLRSENKHMSYMLRKRLYPNNGG